MLAKTLQLLRFTRPLNLFILALTQLLLKYCLLDSITLEYGFHSLPNPMLAGLVIATVLIAAGGNIYNDLRDLEADRVNRQGKKLLADYFTPREQGIIWVTLMTAGLVIGIVTALNARQSALIPVFLLSALLLWLYSRYLKASVLWGNLCIAALAALSLFLIVWASHLHMSTLSVQTDDGVVKQIDFSLSWALSGFFMFFAFITTLIRELVKDRQDLQGDRVAGYRTLATAFPHSSLILIMVSLFIIQVGLSAFAAYLLLLHLFLSTSWVLLLMLFSLLLMSGVFRLRRSDAGRVLSLRLKQLMIAGMLTMLIIFIEWNGFGMIY